MSEKISLDSSEHKYENIKYWINRLGRDGRKPCVEHGKQGVHCIRL